MPFRFLQRVVPSGRTQRRFGQIGSTAWNWIGYPFRLVFGLAVILGQTIATWWESRNLRFLLQGLPALVVAIGAMVVGAMVFFQDRSALAQDYQEMGRRALFQAQQMARTGKESKPALAMAQTCYKRLSQLQTDIRADGRETMYHMGETYMLQRQPQAAESIFTALSPMDPSKPGYGPAHFEVARRLIPPQNPNPNPSQIQQAEYHLRRAVAYKSEPYSAYARTLLFDLLRVTNRPDDAEAQLVQAVREIGDQMPETRTKLANWYIQNQKRELAEKQIELAITALEKKVDENIDDNRSRLLLTECLKSAGRLRCAAGDFKKGKEYFARARDFCDSGRALATDPQVQNRYLELRYELLLAQFESFESDPNKVPADQFDLLEKALLINPNGMQVLQRLVGYIRLTGPEGDKTRKQFDDLLANGTNSIVAHFVLGADAFAHDDFASAKYHWEKALEASNGAPTVANNLAWLLAMKLSPPDYARALELIDAALRQQDAAEYHGTKGHILAKMGRYDAALPELDKAKMAYATRPTMNIDLFTTLAEVCDKLGMAQDAKRYHDRVDELKKHLPAAAKPVGPTGSTPPAADSKTPPTSPPAAPKP